MVRTLSRMRRFSGNIIVSHWSIPILGIDDVFTLVIDDVHALILLGGQSFWMQLFLVLLSRIRAIHWLVSGCWLPPGTIIEILVLLGVCWFHVCVFVLSHVQLAGYLLALAYCTVLRGLRSLIACTWPPLIFRSKFVWSSL